MIRTLVFFYHVCIRFKSLWSTSNALEMPAHTTSFTVKSGLLQGCRNQIMISRAKWNDTLDSLKYIYSINIYVANTIYIANRSRWKNFVVAELNCNSLENICSVDGSLAWPKPIAHAILLEKFHSYWLIRENCETFHLEYFAIYGIQYVPYSSKILWKKLLWFLEFCSKIDKSFMKSWVLIFCDADLIIVSEHRWLFILASCE